jgi:hypothetical protein
MDLSVETQSERPSLVTTAMMETASGNIQRSDLLLSNRSDVLHELVQFARLD